MNDSSAIPVGLRVHLAHAAVQSIADGCRADILHVKGPALDAALRPTTIVDVDGTPIEKPSPRWSTDADILVRPAHVPRMMRALTDHAWDVVTRFETGSVFEHAASLWHSHLGYVDVHRRFPGIQLDAAEAFELMWRGRHEVLIAHQSVAVPAIDVQRLVLLLHAARGGGLKNPDGRLWTEAAEADQQRTLALAEQFNAEVALAAATGRLDEYAHDPTAPLWRVMVAGGTPNRVDEWVARFRAAPGIPARARVLGRSLIVNTDHLAMRLHRAPTRAEVAEEYLYRVAKLGREGLLAWRRRVGKWRS